MTNIKVNYKRLKLSSLLYAHQKFRPYMFIVILAQKPSRLIFLLLLEVFNTTFYCFFIFYSNVQQISKYKMIKCEFFKKVIFPENSVVIFIGLERLIKVNHSILCVMLLVHMWFITFKIHKRISIINGLKTVMTVRAKKFLVEKLFYLGK